MYLNVQKTADRPNIIAVRDDGVSVRVRTPDRKFSPPHDLIHFVVEKGMRLQWGFWGSVADGAKFASVEVIDGRQKPRANERSAQIIKANEAHLSESEMIVGVFQKVLHEDMRPHQEVLWRLLQTSGRKVETDLLRPTWDGLVSFRDQWESLRVGQAIQLEWRSTSASKSKNRSLQPQPLTSVPGPFSTGLGCPRDVRFSALS
jgi:hypothetical protein